MDTTRGRLWCALAALAIAVEAYAATGPAAPAAPGTTTAAAAATTSAAPSPTTTPVAPPPTAATPAAGSTAASTAATAAAAPAAPGGPITRAAYRTALDRAASEHNRHRAACRPMKGNERTVCIAEAKAEAKRAESAAEAAYRNTARARMDARVIAANADYAVAKARCNAKSGTERRTCLRAAKDKQSAVITAAMRAPL